MNASTNRAGVEADAVTEALAQADALRVEAEARMRDKAVEALVTAARMVVGISDETDMAVQDLVKALKEVERTCNIDDTKSCLGEGLMET